MTLANIRFLIRELPFCTGIELPSRQYGLDLIFKSFDRFPVIPFSLKIISDAAQIFHGFDHLTEGMEIVRRIVLYYL